MSTLLRSASSDLKTKAHNGVDEESAQMRIDTTGLFNLYMRFKINKKSNTIEQGIHDHSRIEKSKTVSET